MHASEHRQLDKRCGGTRSNKTSTMTVAGLARRADEPAHVVRYYTRVGLLEPKRQRDNDYKLFSERDLGRLRFIRRAQNLGYTLSEIREIFQETERGRSPCPRVREILQGRIAENRRRLAEMTALQDRMEAALEAWKDMPDGVPDGHTICELIESTGDE